MCRSLSSWRNFLSYMTWEEQIQRQKRMKVRIDWSHGSLSFSSSSWNNQVLASRKCRLIVTIQESIILVRVKRNECKSFLFLSTSKVPNTKSSSSDSMYMFAQSSERQYPLCQTRNGSLFWCTNRNRIPLPLVYHTVTAPAYRLDASASLASGETWWHTATHARASEGETGEMSG